MRKLYGLFAFVVLSGAAQAAFVIELKGGAPFNANTPLYYWQKGQPDVTRVSGRWYSEPFQEAPYYTVRLGLSDADSNAWEIETIHHKVIMENPPSVFRSFNISHGYNFFTVNRLWQLEYFGLRVGGGIILAHPEAVMADGQKIPWVEGSLVGFQVAGIGFQVAVERKWFVWEGLFVNPEVKLTIGHAQVDIIDGFSAVPNVALHITAGVGYRL